MYSPEEVAAHTGCTEEDMGTSQQVDTNMERGKDTLDSIHQRDLESVVVLELVVLFVVEHQESGEPVVRAVQVEEVEEDA